MVKKYLEMTNNNTYGIVTPCLYALDLPRKEDRWVNR